MNKKILLIVLSFLCLSSTYSLELPEQINDLGRKAIHIWFWELDDSVDDRSDIEANVLMTIQSTNSIRIEFGTIVLGVPNLKIFAYWLDSGFENYQHFDDVIDKIDNGTTQLRGFEDYIIKNYGYERNNYHILMTESKWDTSDNGVLAGLASGSYNYAIASDDSEINAAHEMGHMLGAEHNDDTSWPYASVMYDGSGWYKRFPVFWNDENKRKSRKKLSKLRQFPGHSDISYRYGSVQSTTIDGTKYKAYDLKRANGRHWDKSSTKIYEMPTSSKFTYTIEIEKANFDTYIYIYNDKGVALAADDDGGSRLLSKLSNQYFGLNKKVYIVVSGYNNDKGNFTIKIDRAIDSSLRLDPKKTYSIKALNGTCGLEWDAVYKDYKRNAKFDCAGRSDPIYFEKHYENETYLIKTKAGGRTCALKWEGPLEGINATFDCVGRYNSMYITRDADGYYYIKTMFFGRRMCGLKVDSNISNGERNTKFDCRANPDPLIITEVGLK